MMAAHARIAQRLQLLSGMHVNALGRLQADFPKLATATHCDANAERLAAFK